MAWGISPRKTEIIPLNDYNSDHYLTLLYHAFANLGWHIGYFNRDGIIGYTNISWQSYAEEVSVRIVGDKAIVKSECVGYQMLFTDYEKNSKNLGALYNEINYVEFHLKDTLQATTQDLIDSIPDSQFINLNDPPLGFKEKLNHFFSVFNPKPGYTVTPILVLLNIAVYISITMVMVAKILGAAILAQKNGITIPPNINMEEMYLSLGFSNRLQVLNGQVWRLLSNTFLHFSFMHIFGNMIVLIYIGSMLESKLGKWNYLFLYLLAGICASVSSVLWHNNGVMAGASGAIFGLFGILLALLSTKFYESHARRALLISTAIFVGYCIIPKGGNIDHAAHIGGLVAGYVFGWIAYLCIKIKKQNLTVAFAAVIAILFTGISVSMAPVYQLKELQQLSEKVTGLTNDLNDSFYRQTNLNRQEHLALLNTVAVKKMDTLNSIGKQIGKLSLPKKQKQIAQLQAAIVTKECEIFGLLYKEFKEDNKVKYRSSIYTITEQMNDLRYQWGKLEEKE
ncbi:rhomboid family intramembrane serine protease [Mucilaginibacter conchicola]|uniref:Rhomboid family intramembrane serine protease n=1 Tax=Mucilaginibacter conchicola TaxID=2303333 RepID=A0A372P083_9SPHI|nr:rhomboid family intramembrane serine protease [Mucilaginibacter conchicola]RFZ95534.1 rhomboid family intramembrane serine protease [Mucilaginibacter conchicola]